MKKSIFRKVIAVLLAVIMAFGSLTGMTADGQTALPSGSAAGADVSGEITAFNMPEGGFFRVVPVGTSLAGLNLPDYLTAVVERRTDAGIPVFPDEPYIPELPEYPALPDEPLPVKPGLFRPN